MRIGLILTVREKDFLKSIIEYFAESNSQGYVKTRKGYKFSNEEMDKLWDKLKEGTLAGENKEQERIKSDRLDWEADCERERRALTDDY